VAGRKKSGSERADSALVSKKPTPSVSRKGAALGEGRLSEGSSFVVGRGGCIRPLCRAGARPLNRVAPSSQDRPMTHARRRPFTLEELRAYLVEIFPEVWTRGDLKIEDIAPMSATLRLVHHPRHLRPGGTISGPAMFALCDVALYVAILSELGRVEHAVTTNVSINFLRKPAPADLIGRAKLIKLGKRLAVGEVALFSEGESDMVAQATGTYSIPARADDGVS
jgi:uncharacterized protein (TIGR00369 family)